ncbi:pyridine nucleotide-disulfide oxidoreductase [Terrimesophilobacter mesophilus]|uniref:Pyridine nucleotide-disulfide oxidoreductase n=1 Tax=Terrimesophilobacter mesophilus TaxID=433647 RepID=A0A4R8VEC5_9MICO|nr:pyridine nucleotide-disulfide oxidoreductase [Terrimesophilobacter mesophilus]
MEVDVLVIGWGKGGKTLAGALGRHGRTVAMVEQSEAMYGGSCINIACVPTKDLVHSAAERRPGDDPQTWFTDAVAGRDDLTARLRARNHAMLAEVDTVTLIDGRARFVGPHEVEVSAGSELLRIRAESIVINTGTVPAVPAIAGASESARVYDSTTIQHVSPLPERLLIVGGGYVGLEFAGMFAHFGSRVTVVDHGEQLMPHEDRDVADAVRALLEESGVEFVLGADVKRIEDRPDALSVTVASGGAINDFTADAVLVATGRTPTTDGLDLDNAGIAVDDRGYIVVDDHLRTPVPGVFAVGDINGGPQFTYISLDDHRIVLDQLVGKGLRSRADRVAVPSTVFLTPPLARVGMNETQARASGRAVLVASKRIADIAAMPRPKIVGETHGLIKVLVDPDTDLILGATVFSIDAQEVINLLALAMRAGVTATTLRDGIWTHPSSTEALNEVLAGLS